MIRQLPYTCRVCGTKRVAEYDDQCPGVHIARWLGLIVCDRCHDYLVPRRRTEACISRLCLTLETVRMAGRQDSNAEAEIRRRFESLTRRYAKIVCDYYWLQPVWEQDWVEQLMEHPGKAGVIVAAYVDGIRRIAKQKQEKEAE